MATTQVEVVSPGGLLYSGQAEMVVCRTEGGDIAFLAHHMPYVGALEAHPLRVVGAQGGNQGQLEFDVQGGFVEVSNNRVVVLADATERGQGTSQ